jgi:rSAM/selenodomain-associated transferase 2
MHKISVIVPVLNEAEALETLIPYLKNNSTSNSILEILIADGESSDSSAKIAEKLGARVVTSTRGRARQMNAAAAEAKGDILYFLHADTLPPHGYDTHILKALQNKLTAGSFRLRFDMPNLILKIFAWLTRFNSPICRGGDQSLFIPSQWFKALGGYNENFVIYEDNDLTNQLYQKYSFTVLPYSVTTSARRYREIGTLKLQYHFGVIHLKHRCGSSPDALWRYYKKYISRN